MIALFAVQSFQVQEQRPQSIVLSVMLRGAGFKTLQKCGVTGKKS